MHKKIAFGIASLGGVGFAPKASGTFGSLITLPFAFVAAYYAGVVGILLLAVLAFVLGVKATREVLKHTKHDPGLVVIDEFAGQMLAFVLVAPYLYGNINNWWIYGTGFILFRIFDIFKFGPVKWADEKIMNEYGVMIDDVFAGLLAAIVLYGFVRFI